MNSWQRSCATCARDRATPWKNWAWTKRRTRYGTGGRISQVQEHRTNRGREVTDRAVEVARDIHGMILFGVVGAQFPDSMPNPVMASSPPAYPGWRSTPGGRPLLVGVTLGATRTKPGRGRRRQRLDRRRQAVYRGGNGLDRLYLGLSPVRRTFVTHRRRAASTRLFALRVGEHLVSSGQVVIG